MGRKRVKKEVIEGNDNQKEKEAAIKVKANNKKLKSSAKFKCSECSDDFDNESDANKHILTEHYGLARINDNSKTPFTENEIIKALIKAQKSMKVLICKNNGCDKQFKSGLGLKMHWDICGKSETETTKECTVCGKRLKVNSLALHMRVHKFPEKSTTRSDSDNTEIDEPMPEPISGQRSGKRASAIRAQEVIRKSTRGEVVISGHISDEELVAKTDSDATEEDIGPEEVEEEAERTKTTQSGVVLNKQNVEQNFKSVLKLWADFVVSINTFLREVPKDYFEKWKKEVAINGAAKCPLPDCTQEFTSKEGLKYHYRRCGMDLKFMWKCKLCGFEASKGNRVIVQHLWSSHKESIPEISSELSQCIVTANVWTPVKNHKLILESLGTIDCVKQFHQHFYQRKSFPKLLPNKHSWTALNEEWVSFLINIKLRPLLLTYKQLNLSRKECEYNIYIHNSNPSVSFRSTLSVDSSWIRLNLFESIATKQALNFFVGGPVWAASWCPFPLDNKNGDQFLAIASNMNPEIAHTLNDTEIESGLIQLWNVGPLGSQFDASLKPRMAFSVAHFCGMIWDMEWCPGGTASHDINLPKRTNSEILPRLGLLAIACGDGFIRVHSIPLPESLPNSYDYSLYYNEPIIILNPPGVGNSVNCENTICKCLSWIRSNDQSLIVGGYGSGIIAVWDLTTKSSLLIVEQNPSQSILRPLNSWIGHSATVNRIKWVHNSSNDFVVSCSFDRSAKLWNLKDLAVPVTVFKRGLFTSIDTHMQWNGMFLAGDDCYQGFQNNSLFKDFGFFNFSVLNLTCHKSCVWDMSVSEWTSAIVSVDAAGEAALYPTFQFKSEPKRKTYDRIPLYHMSAVLLEECSQPSIKSKAGRKSNKIGFDSGVDPNLPPLRNYTEFSTKYGLVFNDYDLSNLKAVPMDEINRIRLPNLMQYQRLSDYPLQSINRVCWNPNLTSCAWILSATQSGLCRLSCVGFLTPRLTDP